jgi:hypothetical protein
MDLAVFPSEITQIILEHLPIKDLIRAERTSKLLQLFCLSEIERRIKTGSLKDEFGVLVSQFMQCVNHRITNWLFSVTDSPWSSSSSASAIRPYH